jgi:hypothetical protein
MVARNYSYEIRRVSDQVNPRARALANRVRRYFDDHPHLSREDFLVGALQHKIDVRQPLSINDLQIHAWLLKRQVTLDRVRSSWRAKAKRWFQR